MAKLYDKPTMKLFAGVIGEIGTAEAITTCGDDECTVNAGGGFDDRGRARLRPRTRGPPGAAAPAIG